ncbi:class I SAM-dependent DNA methyltransferase [Treponema succinifaciens]|uniref:N-6 DNA methylase n=1 Tax=Treponema succinifaciens TaxID=167 RepID=UPI0023F2DFE4|nr:class I SAM-dependent DNA methyltransferase [Treponema succinifaciens]
MTVEQIKKETFSLIDALKATCQQYGMGNDGNEYKIITQVFLYKFLNDKFCFEVKKLNSPIVKKILESESFEKGYASLSEDERLDLLDLLDANIPRLKPEHLIGNLWSQQSKETFDTIFDATMRNIADENIEIFNTHTSDETKIPIFEDLTIFVTDTAQRPAFARALVDKLIKFSFEEVFAQRYDFFAAIFEYLIKDYNTAGGGKYAEYYTPHSIATIMARLLVGNAKDLHNIECYDPSAGTGTLLMALAHQVGEDKCTIYSQDISQRSNKMLKLNLLLNNLVLSLDKVIQGDTLVNPYHKSNDGNSLRKFDYVVSNPPFKMDFSDTREKIALQTQRFWAGVPNVPAKKKESMAIYTCFIQHVINSLKDSGKGAIVVPTGFITAKSGIENKILKKIVDEKIVSGVVSMPSNVFATTGTNVSVIFFDKSKKDENAKVILIDASKLGEEYKEGSNQKRRLRDFEIDKIVDTFLKKEAVEDFSVAVTYDEIIEKGYVLSAGQYFDIKIEYVDITAEEFSAQMKADTEELSAMFQESRKLEEEIQKQLNSLRFNDCETK